MKQNALVSSFHGVPNLVRFKSESLLLSFVWLVAMLVSFGFCCWYIFTNVSEFLEYDVFAKSRIVTDQRVIELPAFTFCLAYNDNTPLSELLIYCYYNSTSACSVKDFQRIKVSTPSIASSGEPKYVVLDSEA